MPIGVLPTKTANGVVTTGSIQTASTARLVGCCPEGSFGEQSFSLFGDLTPNPGPPVTWRSPMLALEFAAGGGTIYAGGLWLYVLWQNGVGYSLNGIGLNDDAVRTGWWPSKGSWIVGELTPGFGAFNPGTGTVWKLTAYQRQNGWLTIVLSINEGVGGGPVAVWDIKWFESATLTYTSGIDSVGCTPQTTLGNPVDTTQDILLTITQTGPYAYTLEIDDSAPVGYFTDPAGPANAFTGVAAVLGGSPLPCGITTVQWVTTNASFTIGGSPWDLPLSSAALVGTPSVVPSGGGLVATVQYDWQQGWEQAENQGIADVCALANSACASFVGLYGDGVPTAARAASGTPIELFAEVGTVGLSPMTEWGFVVWDSAYVPGDGALPTTVDVNGALLQCDTYSGGVGVEVQAQVVDLGAFTPTIVE